MSGTLSEIVDTKHGKLKLVIDRASGELLIGKSKIINPTAKGPPMVDPEVAYVSKCIRESGMTPEEIETKGAAINRPVSRWTVIGLLHEATKRPQNFTLTSIMMAMGYEKKWNRKVN